MKTLRFIPQWFSENLDDLIFENRNKVYGAYDLRRHYAAHLKKAFLITITTACTILLLLMLFFQSKKMNTIFTAGDPAPLKPTLHIKIVRDAQPASLSPRQNHSTEPPTKIIQDSSFREQEKDTTSQPLATGVVSNEPSSPTDQDSVAGGGEGIAANIPIDDSQDKPFILTPEIYPAFPGGQKALTKYLQNHLDFSRMSPGARGKIYFSFIVMKDGSITDIEILRDNIGFGCGEQGKRAIQNMPKWSPGIYNNHTVNVKMILPISIESME